MTASGATYSANIPSQLYSAKVYFTIKNGDSGYISHNFKIQPEHLPELLLQLQMFREQEPFLH